MTKILFMFVCNDNSEKKKKKKKKKKRYIIAWFLSEQSI